MRANKKLLGILLSVLLFFMISTVCVQKGVAAEEPETIAGVVTKTDKGIVIEAEDGDYLVKGADLSKMIGKLVEATGVISETDKGDHIDVKSFEEIQE
jgi:biopolymer transport protein ExbD